MSKLSNIQARIQKILDNQIRVFPRKLHWDKLQGKMMSGLVQATIVIPVIGYIILFSAELQESLCLVFEDCDTTSAPLRLYLLYFGFCCVAVAAIIFNWQCPDLVKYHGAAYRFVEREHPIMSNGRLKLFEMTLALHQDRAPRSGAQIAKPPVDKDVMRDYFEYLEETKFAWRVSVYVFYWSGAGLIALPTVGVFFQVFGAFTKIV